MKITFINWFQDRETEHVLEKFNVKHKAEVEVVLSSEAYVYIEGFFNEKANVQIRHANENPHDMFICVSKKYKSFGQR